MRGDERTVALVGVTASGKSQLAHEVARDLGTVEIATVDAMTVYRGMDLGTAKATVAERAEVPYHLLDLVDPDEEFTVVQFQAAAREVAAEVARRGHHLLYVGGTGLYGRAVVDGLEVPGQFPVVRAELEARVAADLAGLYEELCTRDPVAAGRTTATNARRIVRALEVTLGSGRPFSSYGPGLATYPPSTVHQVGLRVPLDEIDHRIAARFDAWMAAGLLDEVRGLAARTQSLSRTARQAVGYRELLAHVAGALDLATAIEHAVTASRRLARRQRSWFARDPRIEWHDDTASARAHLVEWLAAPTTAVGD